MSSARIIKYVAGKLSTNVYLVFDEESREAFIIDPAAEFAKIHEDIGMFNLKPIYLILTHGHGDHTDGIDQMRDMYPGIKLVCSARERKFLYDRDKSRGKGGYVPDITVADGDELSVGNIKLKIIETPGHTPGGMCILMDDVLFSGDTLFFGSIGRTDLPGGNEEQLIASVREKLMTLPDDTLVLPGHMRETKIGFERSFNPFV